MQWLILHHLNSLSFSPIGNESAGALGEALRHNSTLTSMQYIASRGAMTRSSTVFGKTQSELRALVPFARC